MKRNLKKIIFNSPKCLINLITKYHKIKKQLTEDPIIIGGCGRSGTTLLLSILSAHPDIYAIDEETSTFCPTAYLENFNPKAKINMLRFYCFLNKKIPKTCNRWCEKTPKNVMCFGKILKYFNNKVKIIHIIRDGRDVILSKHPSKPDKYWVSPERWIKDVSTGLKYKGHPNVYTLKYEDLILNYQNTMKKLCAFLDIEFNQKILNWHKYATVRRNNAFFGEVRTLSKSSINKWEKKENKERVKDFLKKEKAKESLIELGYIK